MNNRQTSNNPRFRYISEMNITSLADVAINLMIIFLIAGISVALSRAGISVTVPRSSAAVPQRTEGITVTVDKQGKLYVEDKLTTFEELGPTLNQILSKKATSQVYLVADETVNYGLVINAISKIREAGIENVGLVATPQMKRKK
jgi:biopolymer transport protein TolR